MPRRVESEKRIESKMPLTTVLITLVAAGLLLWLVNRFIPMQGQIDLERPGRHRFGFVDCEPLRAVSAPPSISRRALTDQTIEACKAPPANLRQQGNTAALWLREIL
jgi:hypothetical protein